MGRAVGSKLEIAARGVGYNEDSDVSVGRTEFKVAANLVGK